jgi:hypothetical protein
VTEVLVVDPLTDERWDQIARSDDGDVFHSTGWLRVLSLTYGFSPRAILVVEDAEAVAGAVYVDLDGFGRVSRKCLPFSDFCDPLLARSEAWPHLVDALLDDGLSFTMRCRTSRHSNGDDRFRQTGHVSWHRCDVSRSTDEIWESLHPSARRAIRKAEKAGVDVRPAEDLTDVRDFYLLHLEVRARKYGMLAQPFSFFENIWYEFLQSGQGELLLARFEDRVIGGTVFLDWGGTAYYKFNASDVDLLAVRPNDLLVWSGIRQAHKRGLVWLDFGVSDLDQPGLIRFKEKYATEAGEVITYLAGAEAEQTESEVEARRLVAQMSHLAAGDDVPRFVTERVAELLYRYFA